MNNKIVIFCGIVKHISTTLVETKFGDRFLHRIKLEVLVDKRRKKEVVEDDKERYDINFWSNDSEIDIKANKVGFFVCQFKYRRITSNSAFTIDASGTRTPFNYCGFDFDLEAWYEYKALNESASANISRDMCTRFKFWKPGKLIETGDIEVQLDDIFE